MDGNCRYEMDSICSSQQQQQQQQQRKRDHRRRRSTTDTALGMDRQWRNSETQSTTRMCDSRSMHMLLILAASFCSTASSFHQPATSYRTSSSSAFYASTIVPNPVNRDQHVEFWLDYLGFASPASSSPPFQRRDNYSARSIVEQDVEWFRPVFASTSAAVVPPSFVATKVETPVTTALVDVSPEELSYVQRKEKWAAKYTSVEALRETFGTNRNVVWGDLDAKTTRRLYKTLLPRALLELHCSAVSGTGSAAHPEDLAPLAYQARVAAKMYARERCELPARIAANLYDGFRQWKRYGHFNCKGMSYQQLWEKYASVILHDVHKNQYDLTVEDVTAKICLKILERSCQTNSMVDSLVKCHEFSSSSSEEDIEDLKFITAQLEADARSLLQPGADDEYTSSALLLDEPRRKKPDDPNFQQQKVRLLRSILRMKRKFERFQQQQQHPRDHQ